MIRLLLGGDDDLVRGLRWMLVVGLAVSVGAPVVQYVLAGGFLGQALGAVTPFLYVVAGPLVQAAFIGLVVRAVGLTLMAQHRADDTTAVSAPAAPVPPADATWRPPPTR